MYNLRIDLTAPNYPKVICFQSAHSVVPAIGETLSFGIKSINAKGREFYTEVKLLVKDVAHPMGIVSAPSSGNTAVLQVVPKGKCTNLYRLIQAIEKEYGPQ